MSKPVYDLQLRILPNYHMFQCRDRHIYCVNMLYSEYIRHLLYILVDIHSVHMGFLDIQQCIDIHCRNILHLVHTDWYCKNLFALVLLLQSLWDDILQMDRLRSHLCMYKLEHGSIHDKLEKEFFWLSIFYIR